MIFLKNMMWRVRGFRNTGLRVRVLYAPVSSRCVILHAGSSDLSGGPLLQTRVRRYEPYSELGMWEM